MAQPLTKIQKNRIDLNLLPRPLIPIEASLDLKGKQYETTKYIIPPSPNTVYTILDRGGASCRFIRSTLYQIPATRDALDASNLPLAIAIQLFPTQNIHEEPIPLLGHFNSSETNISEYPLRCPRCHAYASIYFSFPTDTTVLCNICEYCFPIPSKCQSYVLKSSKFSNSLNCPLSEHKSYTFVPDEFSRGTVDYIVNENSYKALKSKVPYVMIPSALNPNIAEVKVKPPAFGFLIDITFLARESGLTYAAINTVKYTLNQIQQKDVEVCIMTYSDNVYFYNLSFENQSILKTMTMPDINDPFCPASPTVLFCSIMRYKNNLNKFLDSLQEMLQKESTNKLETFYPRYSCGYSAVKAAIDVFTQRKGGGTLKFFHFSSNAELNIHKPEISDKSSRQDHLFAIDQKVLDADLIPIIQKCSDYGICIDVFLCCMENTNAKFGYFNVLASQTGGQTYYYPNFNATRSFQKLCADVSRQLLLPAGYNCFVKFRCSRGLTTSKIHGNFTLVSKTKQIHEQDPSTVCLSRIDSTQTLLFELNYEDELPVQNRNAYIQCACLYTTSEGYVRLRVITFALEITNLLSTVFRYSEAETIFIYLLRKHITTMSKTKSLTYRNELYQILIRIIFSYRISCAAGSSVGQLVLPDALKNLPVYILGLFKKLNIQLAPKCNKDEILHYLIQFMGLSQEQATIWVYPRVCKLFSNNMDAQALQSIGYPLSDDDLRIYFPPPIPCNGSIMTTDGIYLLDNGITYILFIGSDVDQSLLLSAFDTPSLEMLNPVHFIDPSLIQGTLGRAITCIINQLNNQKLLKFPWQPFEIIRKGFTEEIKFQNNLVEDQFGSEDSYVGFLCTLHKAVIRELDES